MYFFISVEHYFSPLCKESGNVKKGRAEKTALSLFINPHFFRHPFTAPLVMPATIFFCAIMKKMTIGIIVMIAAAKAML